MQIEGGGGDEAGGGDDAAKLGGSDGDGVGGEAASGLRRHRPQRTGRAPRPIVESRERPVKTRRPAVGGRRAGGSSSRHRRPFGRARSVKVSPRGRSTGQGIDELYADIVPKIPVRMTNACKTLRATLAPGPAGSRRGSSGQGVPPFARLLPTQHRSRDFIPLRVRQRIHDAAVGYIAQRGEQLAKALSAAAGPSGEPRVSADQARASSVGMAAGLGRVQCGTQLVERDWTVLSGAMTSAHQGGRTSDADPVGGGVQVSAAGGSVTLSGRDAVDRLLACDAGPCGDLLRRVMYTFPGEADIDGDPVWGRIHNVDDKDVDAEAFAAGQGRMMMRLSGLSSDAVNKAAHEAYRLKLLSDMLMTAMAHEVLAGAAAVQGTIEIHKLRTPASGSRVLLTTSQAARQRPHIDAAIFPASPDPAHPEATSGGPADVEEAGGGGDLPLQAFQTPSPKNFFVIAAGEDGFTVIVYPGSSLVVHRQNQQLPTAVGHVPERVVVPAGGVLVVRGDLAHCELVTLTT